MERRSFLRLLGIAPFAVKAGLVEHAIEQVFDPKRTYFDMGRGLGRNDGWVSYRFKYTTTLLPALRTIYYDKALISNLKIVHPFDGNFYGVVHPRQLRTYITGANSLIS